MANDEFLNFKTDHVRFRKRTFVVEHSNHVFPRSILILFSKSGRTFVTDFIVLLETELPLLIYLIYFSRPWKIFFSRTTLE